VGVVMRGSTVISAATSNNKPTCLRMHGT